MKTIATRTTTKRQYFIIFLNTPYNSENKSNRHNAGIKKSPDHFTDPGIPDFPAECSLIPSHGDRLSIRFKAGLLTSGLSYSPRLPSHIPQPVVFAVFVPGYSDGPVADLHGIPFSGDCPSRQPATLNFFINFMKPFSKSSSSKCQGIKMCSP